MPHYRSASTRGGQKGEPEKENDGEDWVKKVIKEHH
jgi:hypothetical protein